MLESGLGMSRKAARGRKGRERGALKEQSCPSGRIHVAPPTPDIVQCPDYEVRLLRGIHICVIGVCNYGMIGAPQAAATRAYGGSKKSRYLVRIEKLRIAFGGREKWRLPVLMIKLPKQECLSIIRAGHCVRKCSVVSGASSHFLHVSSGSLPILCWKYLR